MIKTCLACNHSSSYHHPDTRKCMVLLTGSIVPCNCPGFRSEPIRQVTPTDAYGALRQVLERAIQQASAGKGKERHAGDEPFHEQQIVKIGDWLGSNHFEIGQAIKKSAESTRLPPERAVAELLGAINYLAAAIIQLESRGTPG